MFARKLALVVATSALANCSQSSPIPSSAVPNGSSAVTQSSGILPPQSPWRFWNTPTTGSGLAQDKSYNTWFFSSSTSISKINLSGSVKTYSVPTAGSDPVYGNDGNIWFLAGFKIGRVSPTGSHSYFDAGGSTDGRSLTPGFGNDVWFPEQMAAESPPFPQPVIAHMTSNGAVTTYPQPADTCPEGSPFCQPRGIARGPDGNIWFSGKIDFCDFCGLIGKINPVTGAISLQGNDIGSYGNLVVGPDKRLWTIGLEPGPGFNQAHLVGFNTNFALSKDYLLPSQSEAALAATGLTAGRDALYLIGGAVILRVTTSGQITAYSPPSQIPCCLNSIIASGPDDDVWFSTPSGIGVLRQRSAAVGLQSESRGK